MIKNHLISAFRNLIKSKSFTFIHVGGLAIGLTAGIIVLHYARMEYAYDEFHENALRTYRVSTVRLRDGVPMTHYASTFSAVGPTIKADYPEVKTFTRLFKQFRGGIVSYENTHIRETNIIHADSGFFDVFSFPILKGTKKDLLQPGSAFIEERMVSKYFGDQDPIGKRITFGSASGEVDYEIRGIVRCPENSSLKFNFIFNYHDLTRNFGTEHESNWQWLDFHTFVTFKDEVDVSKFEARLKEMLVRNIGDRAVNANLILQPLPSLYLQSKTQFETGITGNETTIRVLLLLGIITMIIVVLNFINLSTSRSLSRAKEVGIRKALGSSRQNLISQFLIETSLINAMACVISITLIGLLLPYFNELTHREIIFTQFLTNDLWKYITAFFAFGTLIIGLYPAIMLSAFNAVEVLKGFYIPKAKGTYLREVFVGLQALVSFSMVAAILTIIDQMDFVNQKKLGINIQETLVVRTPDVVTGEQYLSNLTSFKNALLQDSRIKSVTATVDSPGAQVSWIGGTRKINSDQMDVVTLHRSVIDEGFGNTFETEIISGKMFTPNESNHDIIINQQALAALRINTPEESLTQRLLIGNDTFTIVGVMKDFHQVSPREAISPTVYHYNLETPRLFMIKFESNRANDVVNLAGNLFQQVFPNVPFDYYFLDDFFEAQYEQERTLSSIISLFCGLAIIVSSLGLLGLTWFRLSRQKKELAIRKIIGSTDWQLFVNASRKLIYTTLIGCLIGIPVIWFLMNKWLETFTYHTTPKVGAFIIALASSVVIALISISGHTLKVIKSNPVNHLRQD